MSALVHELDEPATRGVVTLVSREVLTQTIDAFRQ
jgi:hypothetical protein